MDKKTSLISKKIASLRGGIQAAATLLTNIHLPNLFKGKIYQGNAKTVCVPGLNCYSCPAATGACPIGAFQAVVGSSQFKFTYYITGFFILLGVMLGRFICGFKYICPQGVLEGAIPLSLGNTAIRSALGKLFSFKLIILIMVILLSILFYRPFCKWICPLGAIYSLFNKISFLSIKVEDDKCVGCHQCTKVCKMDVDVIKSPNHPECIRCGACMKACPKDAIHYQFIKFNDK